MTNFPPAPAQTDRLDPQRKSSAVLEYLARRRSTPRAFLQAPAPGEEELGHILRIAARVPDHRCLTPWRFVVLRGEAIEKAGSLLAKRYGMLNPSASADEVQMQFATMVHSPLVVMLVFSPVDDFRTPTWEQHLSCGAVGQNLLLSCNAAGYGANWITGWSCEDEVTAKAFDLSENERIAGYFHIGTAKDHPPERKRPDMMDKITYWEG